MLIGLTGYKGSGKGVAALALESELGFIARKFADPLKDMVRSLLSTNGLNSMTIERMIEGELKEVPAAELNGMTPRYAMQTLGVEWGRSLISPTLWIDTLKRRVSGDLRAGWDVVVDDVRFLNEAEAIRRMGGKLVRIRRTGHVVDLQHGSEREIGLIECDYTVANDSDIPSLREAVLRRVVCQ